MSYIGIVLDKWAANESTVIATICIQSLCFLISTLCLIVRLVQVCKRKRDRRQTFPSLMMKVSPLLCMAMYIGYLFTHLWNYIHFFRESNDLDCGWWFGILIVFLSLARIFLYQFLLLRSLVIFKGTIYQASARFVFIFLIMNAILTFVCISVLLSDFTPINPFHGFCFRIVGDRGFIAMEIWLAGDCLSAVIVWIVFWLKVRKISKAFDKFNEKGNKRDMKMYTAFRKQMFLGILTVAGSIIIFVVKFFATVLMGVTFALDATTNNVFLFLFYKENKRVYELLCCANSSCCTLRPPQPKFNKLGSSSNTKSIVKMGTSTDRSMIGEESEMVILSAS